MPSPLSYFFSSLSLKLADLRSYYCFWEIFLAFSAAAFSATRAPARILTASLLFSVQSYSGIGPSIWLRGTIAVHGLVQVDGSSTVNLYSMVFWSVRVKYSVIFKVFAFAPWNVAAGRKFEVSTISVLPSQ